jgi:hypothetical protein
VTDLMTNGPRPGPRLVDSVQALAAAAAEAYTATDAAEVEMDWAHPADTISESEERVTIAIRRTGRQLHA